MTSRYTDLELAARTILRTMPPGSLSAPPSAVAMLQKKLEELAQAIWTQGWDSREEQGPLAGAFGHANRHNPYRRPPEERKCRSCGAQPMHTERGRCEDCGDCQGCGDDDCSSCGEAQAPQGSGALPGAVDMVLFPEHGHTPGDVELAIVKMRDESIPNLEPRVTFEAPAQLAATESEKLPTLQERNDQYVRHVFQACGGHVSNAARTLGIGRATLYRWLTKLGVDFDEREAERKLARRIKHLGRPVRTM